MSSPPRLSFLVWSALGVPCLSTTNCSTSRTPLVRDAQATADANPPCARPGCVERLYDRGKDWPRRGVQVDETTVYWQELVGNDAGWTTGLKVFAAAKTGGGVVRELGDWTDNQAALMLVDESDVYWVNGDKLVRLKKDGTERRELEIPDAVTLDPGAIAIAGDAIVLGSHACHNFALIPKDGSPPRRWAISSLQPTGGNTGIEVDGTSFYCASGHYVYVLDSLTGDVRELVSYNGKAGAVRKVGSVLYWIDTDNPDSKDASLVSFPLAGGAPVPVGPTYGGTANLMLDAAKQKLYWMTGLDAIGCDAVSFDLRSRETAFLTREQNRSGDTAQDVDYVYWSASDSIMRVHK